MADPVFTVENPRIELDAIQFPRDLVQRLAEGFAAVARGLDV